MSDPQKTILIIEDEEKIRDLLRQVLEEADYSVLEAADGVEGEKQILLNSPDMIILDLNLPKRRGEDILKFIKNHKPTKDIPIIILSGEGTLTKKISSMLKGAASFIDKPFDTVELLKTVKKYL